MEKKNEAVAATMSYLDNSKIAFIDQKKIDEVEDFFKDFSEPTSEKEAKFQATDDSYDPLDFINDDGTPRSNNVTKAADTITCEWSNNVTDTLSKPLSKNVTRRLRRSDAKDKETLAALVDYETALAARSGLTVGHLHTLPKHLISTTSTIRLPSWDFTSDRIKLTFANRALDGNAQAWSLNLGPNAIKTAQADPRGLVESLKRSLDRAFKRQLGHVPFYWLAADVDRLGRLHLHGGITFKQEDQAGVEKAFLRVGGDDWAATRRRGNSSTQLHFKPIWHADGWVRYATGDAPKVRKLIKGKTFAIPHDLRNCARLVYQITAVRLRRAAKSRYSS